jgi:hypothetical protein
MHAKNKANNHAKAEANNDAAQLAADREGRVVNYYKNSSTPVRYYNPNVNHKFTPPSKSSVQLALNQAAQYRNNTALSEFDYVGNVGNR